MFSKLRKLDAHPKINEDFYSRTLSGGVITIVSSFVMILLFFSELRLYLRADAETKLVVDTSRGETLRINFDVTFSSLPCSMLSVDAMDISGEQHLDIRHDIIKKRIDSHGNVIESRPDGIGAPKIEKPLQRHGGRLEHNETYCGSCYGAEVSDEDCCNSCEEVREAYRKKGWGLGNPELIDQCKREGFFQQIKDEEGEGCNIYGFLEVNKVAGNFHFTPGKSFHQSNVHVHDLLAFQNSFNVSCEPLHENMRFSVNRKFFTSIMTNEEIRERLGVAPIEEKLIQHRLRWFGHVQRRPPEAPVRAGIIRRVENTTRGRGRPRLTWERAVKGDLSSWNISKELALDRSAWKLAIHVPEP